MNRLLHDVLHDLREKRLWPVAALLLLSLVALPAVMLRSESAPGAPAPAPSGAGADAEKAVVALASEDDVAPSSLDSFRPKDPFKPRGPAAPAPEPAPASATEDPAAASPSLTLPGSGSAPSSGGSGPASGGAPASSPAPPAQQPKSEPVLYTYQVNVSFGRRGKERTRNGIQRLEPIPDSENPMLVFLGTTASGRSAVFLVDRTLEQRGEGICAPKRDTCSLLYLRESADHDLHFFTDSEGRGYALRLRDIELVRVDEVVEGREQDKAKAKDSGRESDRRRARWPYDVEAFADLAR